MYQIEMNTSLAPEYTGIGDVLRPTGSGYPAQIVLGLIVTITLFVVYFGVEYMYRVITSVNKSRMQLLDMTVSAGTKPYVFKQGPGGDEAKTILLSNNERAGVEFSYSFYIYVDPAALREHDGLYHVFHKGYATQFPLLGPGVYMSSNTNKMRVYMNSYKKWDNHVDIDNFPMKKWVHVVLACEGNALNVYVNGNLAKRLVVEGSVPYQNFQDVHLFNNRVVRVCGSVSQLGECSVGGETNVFNVYGAFTGMFSNLAYFNYALSYTEINALMNEGPSKKTDTIDQSRPQYLADTWWVGHAA
jgi:hypothetical protein